jgi:hypothetical protein
MKWGMAYSPFGGGVLSLEKVEELTVRKMGVEGWRTKGESMCTGKFLEHRL